MQNVEFKAELRDPELGHALARHLGAKHMGQVWQVDTYYKLADGRLKKRETEGQPTEWVFYERPNMARARISQFKIYTENQAFERFGTLQMEPWVIVRKARDIYIMGHVRLHFDQVDRLGQFVELEALVLPSHNLAKCYAAIDTLRRALGPAIGEAISASYSDLVAMEPELPPAAEPPV